MVFSGDIMGEDYIGCDNKYGGIDQPKKYYYNNSK